MRTETTFTTARGWITAILICALTGSGLALAPRSAQAIDGVPDDLASVTACAGPATRSAGFTDTVGSVSRAAVDCLAYYGITQGTGSGLYNPSQPVTRRQMALFLARAARLSGINLREPVDQGYRDLDDQSQAVKDAINHLSAAGITRGTSAITFTPNGLVDRRQMALFLYRFLKEALPGPGGVDVYDVVPDDNHFQDIGGITGEALDAIRALYEMGITTGKTPQTFSPGSIVTRGQMALFIARTLDHTNTRPAGLTIQSEGEQFFTNDTVKINVSLRDSQHIPIPGEYVDIFRTPFGSSESDFNNGRCTADAVRVIGTRPCLIDRLDHQLDSDGNLTISFQPDDHLRLWVWTGSFAQTFVYGSVEADALDIKVQKDAVAVAVSDDLPPNAEAILLGEPVEIVLQLVDEDGLAVEDDDGRVQVQTLLETNGIRDRRLIRTYSTDDQGRVRLSFTAEDPDPEREGDYARMDLDIHAGLLDILDRTTTEVVANDDNESSDIWFEWSDDPPSALAVRLTQVNDFTILEDSGPGLTHAITVFVGDQYGDPVANASVRLSSNDPSASSVFPTTQTTDSDGIVRLRYLRDGNDPRIEVITAELEETGYTTMLSHFWARLVKDNASVLGVPYLFFDTTRNLIVVTDPIPRVLNYKNGDKLSVGGEIVSTGDFERALRAGNHTNVTYLRYSRDPNVSNSIDLNNDVFD
ncbi:MAG: S-layer homology domain-containing protein [bacterium]|nr:S-layer homology domain-containing protein [bacterium]